MSGLDSKKPKRRKIKKATVAKATVPNQATNSAEEPLSNADSEVEQEFLSQRNVLLHTTNTISKHTNTVFLVILHNLMTFRSLCCFGIWPSWDLVSLIGKNESLEVYRLHQSFLTMAPRSREVGGSLGNEPEFYSY